MMGQIDKQAWVDVVTDALANDGKTWKDVVHSTMTRADKEAPADAAPPSEDGYNFTVWTSDKIYYPCLVLDVWSVQSINSAFPADNSWRFVDRAGVQVENGAFIQLSTQSLHFKAVKATIVGRDFVPATRAVVQELAALEAAHADEAGAEVQARAWDQLVALTEADNAALKGGAV